jgi:hypothetical protein
MDVAVGKQANKRGKDMMKNKEEVSKSAATGKVKYKRFAIKILI